MNAPACPCCGGEQIGRDVLCSLCWTGVPQKYRAAVHKAQKALGYNPASAKRQDELKYAIRVAIAKRP